MFKKLLLALFLFISASAYALPISIVAAENFYGDIAQQLGGPYTAVTVLMKNPQQDPHLFSSTPNTAKAIAKSQMIIYNGIGYDPWMENLIAVDTQSQQKVIVVAQLIGRQLGDNPHIWYNPHTMAVYADYLAAQFALIDPAHRQYYQTQLNFFNKKQQKLLEKIRQLRALYQGTAIIATEPVFNEMAAALALTMHGKNFQLSVMNDSAPSIADIKDFEDHLTQHTVKVLIYNNQVSNPMTEHLQSLAKKSGIPTVGVSETQPLDQDYFAWMSSQLQMLETALAKGPT